MSFSESLRLREQKAGNSLAEYDRIQKRAIPLELSSLWFEET